MKGDRKFSAVAGQQRERRRKYGSTGDAFGERAACAPAMRPKTVPIVRPKPARYPYSRIFPDIISPAAKRFPALR